MADPAVWTPTIEIYETWKAFCETNSIKSEDRIGTQAGFGQRLRTIFRDALRSQRRISGRRVYGYQGIRLASAADARHAPDVADESPAKEAAR